MPFTFTRLEIPEVILVEARAFGDARGFFMETFKASEFRAGGIDAVFTQDNHSYSQKGVLRGLHYQLPPKAQGKLVRVMGGAVLDVAVDIRRNSPTFKKYVAVELSDSNRRMLWIPPGFAHGFLTLSDSVHFLYKCSDEYDPSLEKGIRWDDPDLAVNWAVPGSTLIGQPQVSARDEALPFLNSAPLF